MGRIGYARVSTTDQDLAEQIAQLEKAGCGIIRSEAASGASREGRDELATILAFIKPDDELVVQRIDRLGRSTRDVLNIVHELDAKQASLRVLDPEITTTGELGRMVITVLGMVAGMELRFIKERQKAGIIAAKARGTYKGGTKKIDDDAIRALLAQGLNKAQVARQLSISRMSVYRTLQAQSMASGPPPAAVPPALPLPVPPSDPISSAIPPIVPSNAFLPDTITAPLILTLQVEINREGTRGRKRAIAEIEEELAAWWDLADEAPTDGDYAISAEYYPQEEGPEAVKRQVEQLIRDLGQIADQRYCYINAMVIEPATGRSWSGVEPAKALRRRRPPRRKQTPARRQQKSQNP